jgi:hypothetical protein
MDVAGAPIVLVGYFRGDPSVNFGSLVSEFGGQWSCSADPCSFCLGRR